MKRHCIYLILVACIALSVWGMVACTKEADTPSTPDVPPHALLSETSWNYVRLLDSNGTTVGTYWDGRASAFYHTRQFEYANGRVVKFTDSYWNSVDDWHLGGSPFYTFEYDEEGNMSGFWWIDISHYKCSYENGLITAIDIDSGSLGEFKSDGYRFSYDNNGRLVSYYAERGWDAGWRNELEWDGDNVIKEHETSNGGSIEWDTYYYTHDDHKNPLHGLFPSAVAVVIDIFDALSANNPTRNGETTYQYDCNDEYTKVANSVGSNDHFPNSFSYFITYYKYADEDNIDVSDFWDISVTVNDASFGHVGNIQGLDIEAMPIGFEATYMATAYEGHRFVGWDDGNTDNPRTITVTDNAEYMAIFE